MCRESEGYSRPQPPFFSKLGTYTVSTLLLTCHYYFQMISVKVSKLLFELSTGAPLLDLGRDNHTYTLELP
jgi:hypothetical protein